MRTMSPKATTAPKVIVITMSHLFILLIFLLIKDCQIVFIKGKFSERSLIWHLISPPRCKIPNTTC
jgi:hypothetical protein